MPFSEELFALAMDFSNGTELPALKERFKEWSTCKDHATAAAFGYLAAMREVERKSKTAFTTALPTCLLTSMKASCLMRTPLSLLFEKIYHWLNEGLVAKGYEGSILCSIDDLFSSLVKPGVVS
jgi:hypothetical protein